MTRIAALLLASTSLLAAEIPAGPAPEIDGAWAEGEWDGAHVVALPNGEARMRVAGRALCVAVRMNAPYAGERIDLYLATKSGSAASLHSFHPASHLPRLPFAALPPVMARRASWERLHRARGLDPYGVRFRSAVYQRNERSWTAEFAIAHEALNLPADQPASFHLRVVHPAAKDGGPLGKAPADWSPIAIRIDPKAALFETPRENARHKAALAIFRDGAAHKALERTFSPKAAGELADRCDGPTFHDLWYRLHLFRRANRIDDARVALRRLLEAYPGSGRTQPVVSERRQLLLLDFDFEKLRETESGEWIDRIEGSWAKEKALRAKDKDLPRAVFETTAGPVTVELYRRDSAQLAEALIAWVRGGGCKDRAPAWATGNVGAAFEGPEFPKDAKPTGRRAWRGTLCLVQEKSGELRLLFATGHVHLYRSASAIGRIVEGQEAVDRLGASDSIRTARAP